MAQISWSGEKSGEEDRPGRGRTEEEKEKAEKLKF